MDARDTRNTAFVQMDELSEPFAGIGKPMLVTEMSDLGWTSWPQFVVVEPTTGNGQPFAFQQCRGGGPEAELVAVVYRQMLGTMELHVLND